VASPETMTLEQDQRISDVVGREQSRLRSFIRRRVPDPRDVEDILQKVSRSGCFPHEWNPTRERARPIREHSRAHPRGLEGVG
jgi:hypothetical protein